VLVLPEELDLRYPLKASDLVYNPLLSVFGIVSDSTLGKYINPVKGYSQAHIQAMGRPLQPQAGSFPPFLQQIIAGVDKTYETEAEEKQGGGQQEIKNQFMAQALKANHTFSLASL
jgi:hypothetical protein